jgi:hypothetical protein
MFIKSKISPNDRHKFFRILLGVAQIALVLGLLLSRLDVEGLDFLEGMLIGFSMVGNLAALVYMGRDRRMK